MDGTLGRVSWTVEGRESGESVERNEGVCVKRGERKERAWGLVPSSTARAYVNNTAYGV